MTYCPWKEGVKDASTNEFIMTSMNIKRTMTTILTVMDCEDGTVSIFFKISYLFKISDLNIVSSFVNWLLFNLFDTKIK